MVKQTVTVVRLAKVEAEDATEALDIVSSAMVAEKCSRHEWPVETLHMVETVPMAEFEVLKGTCYTIGESL